MVTTVNTIAGLLAALKAAKGGDTILLAPGVYDSVSLNNIRFKSMVTIASADPTHQAVLSNLSLGNDAYITFKQVCLSTSTGTAASVMSSNNITFTQDTFVGAVIGSGNAMMVRNSSTITVTGSDFGKFGTGINLLNDSKLTITNNLFHDISEGDVRGTSVTSSTIAGNTFSNADITNVTHVDVVNLWQDNAANHVVIDNNIYGSTAVALPATPAMPTDASVVGGYVNAAHDTISQTINGVAGAGVSVTVYDNGAKVGTVTANSSGAWSYQVGALADGSSHSYTVTATDLTGHTSAASAALKFIVDTSAPVQPGTPTNPSVSNGYVDAAHDTSSQAIGGMTQAGASVAVFDNGTKVATVTASNTGAWSYQVGALAAGSSHSYTVTATDLAGNTSAASAALNFAVAAPSPPPPPPTGAIEVGNVQQLMTALANAHAGDVIALDAGTYDAVTLNNLNFTSAVTITSMDQAHQAVLSNLNVNSSSHLTFDHVGVQTSTGTAVNLQDSHDVTFSNDAFSSAGSGNAMILRNDSGVAITGSDFTQFGTGINVLTAAAVSITGNTFHNMSGDIRGLGLTNSGINGNTFADASSTVADHSDVIALWQDNVANNVTIGTNVWGTGAAIAPPTTSASGSSSSIVAPPIVTQASPGGAQTVTVSNSAQLVAAVWAAHAGDTIKLAAGTYDYTALDGLHFSSAVTVTSADLSHQATIKGLEVEGTSNMAFDHLNILPGTGYGVIAVGAQNVSFSNLTIVGPQGTFDGLGVFVRSSDNVSVTNSEFAWTGSGMAHLDDTNLTIAGNTFHDLNVDGLVGAGSYNVVVSGNSFTSFHPGEGDHPDAIQFFADSTGNSSNILVKDNVITRGTGDPTQGVFIENTNNIEITGNAISGSMYNGISVSNTHEALITDNFIQGFLDMGSRIITRGGSVDVTVSGNTADTIANYGVDGVNINYVQTGNTMINDAAVGDLSFMNTWLSHHVASTATLTDPFFMH